MLLKAVGLGWEIRQNLGQLNLGQIVSHYSFDTVHPFEDASSCHRTWHLLPGGVREQALLGQQIFSSWMEKWFLSWPRGHKGTNWEP